MNIYKHSISFNIVTTDVEIGKIQEKETRIKAVLRFNGQPPLTFSGVARVDLGKVKIKEVKKIVNDVVKTKVVYMSDNWNFENNKPKDTVRNSGLKRRLSFVEEAISSMFLEFCEHLGRFPSSVEAKELHKRIDDRIKNREVIVSDVEVEQSENLLVYIADYIRGCVSKPPTRTMINKDRQKVAYKSRSIQSFLNTLNILIGLKGGQGLTFKTINDDKVIKALPVLNFSDINLEFYDELQSYLGDQGLKVNYLGGQVKYIKKFMNESLSEGLHSNLTYKHKEFVKQTAKADNVSLSFEQLEALQDYDFSDNLSYDNARDLFLVGCWTGLRYSDYSRLTKANLNNGFIDILTKKTNKQVVIPILKPLKEILSKYKKSDTGFPRAISDVKLNKYIKDICRIVGEEVDKSFLKEESVTDTSINGGAAVKVAFYKRVSTHTGRRSFATNAVRLNIPKSVIMQISGHTTEKAFDTYVGIKSREMASILGDYFKNAGL